MEWRPPRLPAPIALGFVLAWTLACATGAPVESPSRYRFFDDAGVDDDIWSQKISDWQARERASAGSPDAPAPDAQTLETNFDDFRHHQRRVLARRVVDWSQAQALLHYRKDPATDLANDPWPTTENLFATNGDDCDGLDLLAYNMLLDFGFPREELYRAIIRRERDGAHHMVTLWFEDPEDPWVVDVTGAMSGQLVRFSELPPGWRPTRVFNEVRQFRAEPRASSR